MTAKTTSINAVTAIIELWTDDDILSFHLVPSKTLSSLTVTVFGTTQSGQDKNGFSEGASRRLSYLFEQPQEMPRL
jgi:hypothetical protein